MKDFRTLSCTKRTHFYTSSPEMSIPNSSQKKKFLPQKMPECCICLEEKKSFTIARTQGHEQHEDACDTCKVNWLHTGKNTCPICARPWVEDEVFVEHFQPEFITIDSITHPPFRLIQVEDIGELNYFPHVIRQEMYIVCCLTRWLLLALWVFTSYYWYLGIHLTFAVHLANSCSWACAKWFVYRMPQLRVRRIDSQDGMYVVEQIGPQPQLKLPTIGHVVSATLNMIAIWLLIVNYFSFDTGYVAASTLTVTLLVAHVFHDLSAVYMYHDAANRFEEENQQDNPV